MIEKNEKFPNALEGVMLMAALMLVEYIIGSAMYDMRGAMGLEPRDIAGMMMIVSNGLIFTFLMEYKGLSYRELFHSSASQAGASLALIVPAILLTVPALIMVVGFLLEIVVRLFPLSPSQMDMFKEMGSGSVGSIIITCLLAPVLEEMLFRGIILRSFLLQYPRWISIFASAAIFGAAHMNVYQFTAAFILGLFLAWLYQRTKSLVPCIVLHAVYNSLLLAIGLTGAEWADAAISGNAAFTLAACFLLAGAGMYVLRRVLPAK
ncbi:CPBP family intramembrane glutamic endopeptidase [Massilia sp. CF038]|uniref:CPBP family intramembrane glutamic endopeptidase n=1 Tax=Massilia sp. CF038 TaxID=1881045 RepID=UPI00090F84E1|nr:CPBP family intramembrane glutamic endopeptidase [Massilia sp. CF038]SHH70027.1 hypothetical protein SAMN05428948_5004 [Massilia sp. CF038]